MNIALCLSGGTGTRLGGDIPKQYMEVGGQMLISFCLKMFSETDKIDGIWIVAAEDWKSIIEAEGKRLGYSQKILGYSFPGDNRQLSIYNGLTGIKEYISKCTNEKNEKEGGIKDEGCITKTNCATKKSCTITENSNDINSKAKCKPDPDDVIVVIHDAARPNLTAEFTERLLEAIKDADGVMPVLAMKDTVYYSKDGKCVDELLERSRIYAGQAPEAYRLGKYLAANEALLPDKILKINGSTEPAVLAGLKVNMICGDENNYKVTTRADLERFKLQVELGKNNACFNT